MNQKKSLVKKQAQAMAKPVAEFIPGIEGVEQDLLVVPRIKLVQRTSDETTAGIPAGTLVNSLNKEVIGKFDVKTKSATVQIIPILNTRSRILYLPFEEGRGIKCRSFDAKVGQGVPGGNCLACPKNQWINGQVECTEFLNVFCIVRGYDYPIPLVASFSRTGFQAGKQLINFFYMECRRTGKSPWYFCYQLTTQFQKSEKGDYFVPRITPDGSATADEIDRGTMFYNMIKAIGSGVTIHVDEEEIKREQERMAKQNTIPDINPDEPDALPF